MRISKDMYVLVGIVGIILVALSLLFGWDLAVTADPVIAGWIGGALPTVFAVFGTLCLSFAFRKEPRPA